MINIHIEPAKHRQPDRGKLVTTVRNVVVQERPSGKSVWWTFRSEAPLQLAKDEL